MKKYLILFAAIMAVLLLVSPVAAVAGSGTAGDPYIVTTPAELQAISSDLDAYYALGNDIDLSGVTWTPIGSTSTPFIGSFDGRNYTISNLVINTPSTSYVGLFAVFGPGAVGKYTKLNNINLIASSNTGGFVGAVIMSSGTTVDAYLTGIELDDSSIYGSGNQVGGIVGYVYNYANLTLTDCFAFDSKIESGGFYCGGIAGIAAYSNSNADFANCYVTDCTIYAPTYSGGVFGRHYLPSTYTVDDCTIERNTIISTGYSAGIGVVT